MTLGVPEFANSDDRREGPLQAELSVRHSYREAARLPEMPLPRGSVNDATVRNRTHLVAANLESMVAAVRELIFPLPDARRIDS